MENNAIQSLFRVCIDRLKRSQFPDYEQTARFIIEHVFDDAYVNLIARDVFVSDSKNVQIDSLLDQCLAGHPLAYVLKTAQFNGRTYSVQPGVLIPRPETEELVYFSSVILNWFVLSASIPQVFECGFGSGVISLELARMFPDFNFLGWDISSFALDTASKNQSLMNISNVTFNLGDFFSLSPSFIQSGKRYVLVSNPPYISESEYKTLEPHVKKEPKIALVADDEGLFIIKQLIDYAIHYSMILICEIGYRQRDAIDNLYPGQFIFGKDLSSHHRFLYYFPPDDSPPAALLDKLKLH